MKYIQDFRKVVYGFRMATARNVAEAQKCFDEGLYDEFDNKSEITELGEITTDGDDQ